VQVASRGPSLSSPNSPRREATSGAQSAWAEGFLLSPTVRLEVARPGPQRSVTKTRTRRHLPQDRQPQAGSRAVSPFHVNIGGAPHWSDRVSLRGRPGLVSGWVGDGCGARGWEGEKTPPLLWRGHRSAARGSPSGRIAVGCRGPEERSDEGTPRGPTASRPARSRAEDRAAGRVPTRPAAQARHRGGQTRGRTWVRDWRQAVGLALQAPRDRFVAALLAMTVGLPGRRRGLPRDDGRSIRRWRSGVARHSGPTRARSPSPGSTTRRTTSAAA